MEENSAADSVDAPPKKKGGVLFFVGAVGLLVASGAGAYFLAPVVGAQSLRAATAEGKSHSSPRKEAHGGDRGDGHPAEAAFAGKFEVRDDVAFYIPEPLIVSIAPMGRARHLKVSLAIETTPEAEARFARNALRLRDVLNVYLRSVDASILEDPAAMTALRAQLRRRVELAVAPAPVNEVLITEFVLS